MTRRHLISPRWRRESGQAMTELVLLLPLFLLLSGIAISFAYVCWQGIKVQQAANLAARIQGQERIGGGVSTQRINEDNGMIGFSDVAPTAQELEYLDPRHAGGMPRPFNGRMEGVYGQFREAVRDLFSDGEKQQLFVPAPTTGINSDEVKVVRVLRPPKILDFQLKPILLEATAYGGEDARMYGLPRWGGTGENPNVKFYQTQIQGE